MNRNLIIVLIIIVLILLGGLIVFSQNSSATDTQINFLSNSSLKSGDSVEFELKDAQGNALANQNLTILFEDNGEIEKYSVITDSEGKGSLVLNNEDPGNYSVTVSFNGKDKYNKCSAKQSITINEETYDESSSDYTYSGSESSSASSSSSSSSSNLNYDSELNLYYDSNGNIVGGQLDGSSYNEVKNKPALSDGDLE